MRQLLKKIWHSTTQQVMSISAVGMALALAADVLIAARLGARGITDGLILALTLPRLMENVGREAIKFSLMTVFIHLDQRDGADAFRDFASRVLNLFLLLGLTFACLGLLLTPAIVRLIGPGLDADTQAQTVTLLRLCLPVAVFALGSAVLEVALNSRKQFRVTALRNSVTPLIVVTIILATWPLDRAAYWIAGGYSVGYACFFMLLLKQARTRIGLTLDLTRWPTGGTLRDLIGTIGYPLTGFTVRQGSRMVERSIASLAPVGGVAAYYFAYRLVAATQTLVGVTIALTGQPRLTQHDLAGDRKRFYRLLRQRVLATLVVSLPIASIILLLHQPIVSLLYGRGSFDEQAIQTTGHLLLLLAPAVVLYCLIPVLTSALYAQKRFGLVLYNMCFAGGTNIVLALLLFRWFGLSGVAMAATSAALLAVINLSVILIFTARQPASTLSTPAVEPTGS